MRILLGLLVFLVFVVGHDGTLRVDIRKEEVHPEMKRELRKRGVVSSRIENLMNFYIVDFGIGSPRQNLSALLDTGSSDLWVFGTTPPIPSMPMFHVQKSSTWNSNNTLFRVSYVSGQAAGTWGTDVVDIGGAKLKGQTFGVVTRVLGHTGVPGIMGLGVPELEASNYMAAGNQYINIPTNLYNQGYIKSRTFSLYLNSASAKYGSILFGGVDHAKYKGNLYVVRRTDPLRYAIEVDAISIDGGRSLGSVNTQLDSGTTLGLLPDSILVPMARELGFFYNSQEKYYYRKANDPLPKKTIDFNLSGVTFRIPLDKMVVRSDLVEDSYEPNQWVLGFLSSNQNYNQVLFGDVFLRNFYIVYDAKNPQIGIAPARYSDESKIQAIDSNTIPGSVRAPFYSMPRIDALWKGGIVDRLMEIGEPVELAVSI
ncbi:hypothetical protein TRICI_001007 [Trichomonascus ciferrii]|uniref:Peptidase A1 domain-containing protein n=1 Tax=Trichomonascus ciferrii TaxID=44093 RepID=A0A642VAL9_9ASCO|nr:hypothetical protein TRICI_001007 [Trichomonascus ciferrii]